MSDPELPLQLNLLGPPEVRVGETLLKFPTRKTLALIAYLAVEKGAQPREHLAALLWPESNPERSFASLRNNLGHLKSALNLNSNEEQASYLLITQTALALNPDAAIRVDLYTLEHAYIQARADRSSREKPTDEGDLPLLQNAAAYYRGDFLTGFSLGDSPDFDDWANIQREVWRRRLGLVLDRLSEIQFIRGDFAATAEAASIWIALDALNEVAYRRRMRAHFAAGERGQALDTYEACRSVLAADLGIAPEPDTEALAERIRTQRPIQRVAPRLQRPDTPAAFLGNLFAGRTLEHQALVERYRSAAAGQPQVIVLRGEAGIGKTRLAREFLAGAVAEGAEVLQGRAFESSARVPYQPLTEAFRPFLERDNVLPEWLGEPWMAPLSHLLPELRDRYPELGDAHFEAEAGQRQLVDSLAHLTLAIAARSPVVLFVDDLQWADSATLDWLVYAIRRWREVSPPTLLLVSVRSETLQPPSPPQSPSTIEWLAHVEREAEPFHLALGPLDEQDTVAMMLSVLKAPAEDFAQWIFNETRGQPFYLIETLKDLLERRALHPKQRAEGQWVFEVDAEHDLGRAVRVPSTVRVVILARLNRLSRNAFTLLAAAAVLELQITFEHLCAVSNLAQDIGLPALDELVSGRLLLEVTQASGASTYAFANGMIRDVVYTEAGDARRRLFHQRALDILEATKDSSSAMLAHHALAAGLAEAAFRYSLTAGQQALRLSAVSEAIAHFEKSRQLAQKILVDSVDIEADIRNLYAQLARAYTLDGQPEQAQAIQDELQSLPPQQP